MATVRGMEIDFVAVYRDSHERIVSLVASASPDDLQRAVPGCPGWAVRDLVAHLTGLATDVVTGNLDGVATPPWTSRQVAERADHSLDEMLAEWELRVPAMLEALEAFPDVRRAVFDILCHEHDLRGALGLPGPSDPDNVRAVVGAAAAPLRGRVAEAGLDALSIRTPEGDEWSAGGGDADGAVVPGVTLEAPTFELFRAMFGRRNQEQVLTYTWNGDSTPYLPLLSLFGALPEARVDEAGAP